MLDFLGRAIVSWDFHRRLVFLMCPVSLPTHFIKLLLCATVNKNLHRKISEEKRNIFDREISMITDVALSSYLMSRAIQNQPWVGSELSLCCESSHLFQLEPGQDGPSSLQSVGLAGQQQEFGTECLFIINKYIAARFMEAFLESG